MILSIPIFYRTVFTVLVSILMSLQASMYAQETATSTLTLAEALEWGISNNLSLAGQRLNVEVATRNNTWANAGRVPIVQANLGLNNGVTRQENPASFINGSFYSGNVTAGITANYTLFNGYRIKFTKQQLDRNIEAAILQEKSIIEQAIFDITSAYYEAQFQSALAQNNKRIYTLNKDRFEYQKLRKSFGQSRTVDFYQTRTNMLSDSVAFEQSKLTYQNAVRNLYLALDADTDTFADSDLVDTLVDNSYDWLDKEVNFSLDSNLVLKNLDLQYDLAKINTEITRAALRPTVSVNGGVNFTENAFQFNGLDPRTGDPSMLIFGNTVATNISIQANHTLFDAGIRKRNVANAIVAEKSIQIEKKNRQKELKVQIENAIAVYKNQRKLLAINESLLENVTQNLALAEEQLQQGAINSFDFRSIQIQYTSAQQQRINLVYNLLLADLNLRRITGKLIQ